MDENSAELLSSHNASEIKRNDNVVDITKPDGIFTILYGRHNKPVNINQIPKDLSGLFIEGYVGGGTPYYQDASPQVAYARKHPQYAPVFNLLESQKTPIYLSNLVQKKELIEPEDLVFPAEMLAMGAETIIGLNLLNKLRTSRRNVLKAGAGAAGLWLQTPLLSNTARILQGNSPQLEEKSAEFLKLSQRLHPEQAFVSATLTNMIMAHKEEWMAHKNGKRPHYVTIIGGAHVGIEDWLQSSEKERLEYFKATIPIIKQVIEPESFYTIARGDYNGSEWQQTGKYEVPELKAIINAA